MFLDTIKTSFTTVITHVQDKINLAIGGRPLMYLYFGGIHPLKTNKTTRTTLTVLKHILYYSLNSFLMNQKNPVKKAIF